MILKKSSQAYAIPQSEHVSAVFRMGDFSNSFQFTYPQWELKITDSDEWSIIAIVGRSGSGKTSLMKTLGYQNTPIEWNDRPVIENISSNPDKAIRCLGSVGFNSMPSWLKPYSVLSNGEKYRAECAWHLDKHNTIYLDEFSSTVDRDTAISLSESIHKAVHRENKQLIVSTCHKDILEALRPCWVVDLDKGVAYDSRGLERQPRTIELHRCDKSEWNRFAPHHYLTSSLPKHTQTYLVVWGETNKVVGFTSCHTLPSGTMTGAYIGSRTVCLPQFQGLGLGIKINELLAEYMTGQGYRYFVKTSHPVVGEYHERSPNWRPTSKNKVVRDDYKLGRTDFFSGSGRSHWELNRTVYSHEFIGKSTWVDTRPQQLSLF